MNYKPGDVVNGHVLTAEQEWVPVGRVKVELGERRTAHSVVFEGFSWLVAAAAAIWGLCLLGAGVESGDYGAMIGVGIFTMAPLAGMWAFLRMLSQRSQR